MDCAMEPNTSSSSIHSATSFPDPADEDVLGQSASAQSRSAFLSRRVPSYTAFISNRTFTPETAQDKRHNLGRAMSHSPSVRAPSETESTNEDWRTAVGGSVHGGRSIKSPSQSPDATCEPDGSSVKMDATDMMPFRKMPLQHSHHNLQHRDASMDSPTIRNRLSSANLQRQSESREDQLRTPQASRQRIRTIDDSASFVSAAPSVMLDELEELKRRINRLESVTTPSPQAQSHSGLGRRTSIDRLRPGTGESYSSSSVGYQSSSRLLSPSTPGHVHSQLRASIGNLKSSDTPPNLLRSLDLACSDALALAAVSLDKTSKHRADSLCRSLTEICQFLQDHHVSILRSPRRLAVLESNIGRATNLNIAHARGHSASHATAMPRSSSSRRSLAEITRSRDDVSDYSGVQDHERTYSRLSRYEDDQQSSRSPALDGPREGFNRSTRGSMLSSSVRSPHSPAPEHCEDDRRSIAASSRGRGDSLGHYDDWRRNGQDPYYRPISRAATEVLERSPITREALYARYQRHSPHQRERTITDDDRKSIISEQNGARHSGFGRENGSRSEIHKDDTRGTSYSPATRRL